MTVVHALQGTPWLFVAVCAALGLLVGSFLNVVVHRLPKMMERAWRAECAELSGDSPAPAERFNLLVPRSRCPACSHPIRAIENVPVVSYLVLRGKCSACGAAISARYPAVELVSGLLTGYAALRFGWSFATVGAFLFVWAMIALAFIDLDTFFLPDDITLPLVWTGLVFNLFGTFTSLHSAVIGAAAGYLALWSVFWAFKLATGKEGMGYGDFKLLAAIGAWLGWKMLPLVILASSFVGAFVGLSLMLFARHERNTPIPFGPYLAIAGLIALFHGETITRNYLELF